jgi:hypothetical protein
MKQIAEAPQALPTNHLDESAMKSTIRLFSLVLCGMVLTANMAKLGAEEPQADADGFVSLFDGESLEGWEGKDEFWSVKEGAITGVTTPQNPTKGNTFLIYRGGKLGDFELRLKFKIVGGNSGIQYRSKEEDDFVVGGYQADIDSTMQFMGILYEERGRGILAQRGEKVVIGETGEKKVEGRTAAEKEIVDSIKKEDWNDYTIIAKGNELTHQINGHTTVILTDDQVSKRAEEGILALQLHAGPPMTVQFKDIKLKKLGE